MWRFWHALRRLNRALKWRRAFYGLCVWCLFGLILEAFGGITYSSKPRPLWGDPCGPNHHWVNADMYGDLSCERIRD